MADIIWSSVDTANKVIGILFMAFYAYQILFILVPIFIRKAKHSEKPLRRYGVLISARNEEIVIRNLIESLKAQTYSPEHIHIFVVADNCNDKTAEIARDAGAEVYERFNTERVGKGYAMEFLYDRIVEKYGDTYFDAYAIFDADNVVDPKFFEEMNKVFSDKYPVVTCYRNSKNYGDNWVSAGYALWFLRESQYLNRCRMRCHTTAAVSGTGFVFDSAIMRETGGWKFFLLTEDIEFTNYNVLKGRKIGYADDAVIYDEQPTKFSQSCHQRMRWARGYIQVMGKFGLKLVRGIFSKKCTSCFDMSCTILPALVLSILSVVINFIAGVTLAIMGENIVPLLISFAETVAGMYALMFVLGAITTVTEWKKIHCSVFKKILYVFTFPIFMISYVPVTMAALFAKNEWKPIVHTKSKSLDEITAGRNKAEVKLLEEKKDE
ncbi:MAG: glycosyltransferase family 2 protein [Clostridia bacterium]|nr:glycosyltransferase family 2 protein [Clostridia bacterium]